jgi:hypothetical protein
VLVCSEALHTICCIDISMLMLKILRAFGYYLSPFYFASMISGCRVNNCVFLVIREQQHGGRPRSEEPRRDDRRAER